MLKKIFVCRKRFYEKPVSFILITVFLCMAFSSGNAHAASKNIEIGDIDIGIKENARMHFTATAKSTKYKATGYYYEGVYLASTQCMGFASWCQLKLYGQTEFTNSGNFKNYGSLKASKMTNENLKSLIQKAGIGAHIRAGTLENGHSMVVKNYTDAGFTIADCNADYKNTVRQKTYTWEEFRTSYFGKMGIGWARNHKNAAYKATAKASAGNGTVNFTVSFTPKAKATKVQVYYGTKKSEIKAFSNQSDAKVNKKTSWTASKSFNGKKAEFTIKSVKNGLKPEMTYYYRIRAKINGAWIYLPVQSFKMGKTAAEHSYKVYDLSMTWKEAKDYCESQGGHLVTITSQEENELIKKLVQSTPKSLYWLGADMLSGEWTWITGEEWSYSNWNYGEPTGGQYVLAMYSDKAAAEISDKAIFGTWLDQPNEGVGAWSIERTGFICEWDDNTENPDM